MLKARLIAGDRAPVGFKFSEKWLYGFLRFFRITCRIASDSASSDRLNMAVIEVSLSIFLHVKAVGHHLCFRADYLPS